MEIKREIKGLFCSQCGGSLPVNREIILAGKVVCPYCNIEIQLPYDLVQEFRFQEERRARFFTASGIKLGDKFKYQGVIYEVTGRIRFKDVRWGDFWDEWFLVGQHGELKWLVEERARFQLLEEFKPKTPPFQIDTCYMGKKIYIEGKKFLCSEPGMEEIVFVEGELPWAANVGDRFKYVDLYNYKKNEVISAELSMDEISFSRGVKLRVKEVVNALGIRNLSQALKLRKELEEKREKRLRLTPWFYISLVLVIIGGLFLIHAYTKEGTLVTHQVLFSLNLDEQQPIGPIYLDPKDNLYALTIWIPPVLPENSWYMIHLDLLNKDRGKVASFTGEFWHEVGFDEDGRWVDSNYEQKFYFKIKEKGEYYIVVDSESSFNKSLLSFRLFYTIKAQLVYPTPLWIAWLGIIVFPGWKFLIYKRTKKEIELEDEVREEDDDEEDDW